MNIGRLMEILAECTFLLRKGEEITGTPELVEAVKHGEPMEAMPGGIVEIWGMPSVDDFVVTPEIEKVDCHFVIVAIHKQRAAREREEFIQIMTTYPRPERLAGGPSYVEVGAEIGSQEAALQMFALGQVLGLWKVITPASFGITGPEADAAAGNGLVMISGFKQEVAPNENLQGGSAPDA
jgi:hypothetical protein